MADVTQALRGRTVAVTGASGSLGQALLLELHRQGAALVALTSSAAKLTLMIAGLPASRWSR